MERSSWIVYLSSSNKILVVNIYFSEKNTLQKTVVGCPYFVSLLGPGKVSFERLTPKRARKLRCGTQKWARKLNSSRNYGTELNHRCGKLAPSPLACSPLSHLILLPCACFIGYTYRILHGKCGRTVFSYELLTSDMERVRFLIQKQRSRENRTKHFPCGIVFVRYRDFHHWFC